MDKNIKIIIVVVVGILLLVFANIVLVSNMRKARDTVDWVPANVEQDNDRGEIIEDESGEVIYGSWAWKETAFSNGNKQEPSDPTFFVMTFQSNGSFSSTTDCNNIMGNFEVDKSELSIGGIGSTLMACENETMQDEYMKNLEGVKSYSVNENGQLILELANDAGSMIFEPIKL